MHKIMVVTLVYIKTKFFNILTLINKKFSTALFKTF